MYLFSFLTAVNVIIREGRTTLFNLIIVLHFLCMIENHANVNSIYKSYK